jgi:hypothetical protein
VRELLQDRMRLFLTFAGEDLASVRPLAAQLRRSGGITLDYAVPSEPFAAQRSDLIRASLALRLKRCAATVCLFGAATLDDEWVRWTLAAADELRQPLMGSPLAQAPRGVADLLASVGVEIVPFRGDAIARRLARVTERCGSQRLSADQLALTLRMMKHPLR